MSYESFATLWLAINLVFGALSAYAAKRWGREPFGWLLIGTILGPLGCLLLIALRISDIRDFRRLPPGPRVVKHAGAALRVLVATDGSVSSANSVQYVVDSFGATLDEVTVISVLPLEMSASSTRQDDSPRRRLLEKEIQAHLGTACARLRAAGIVCKRIIRFGEPANEILRVAEEGQFDLIIMGRRGRRSVDKLLLGSVSEKVVREASCPVIVVS